jgi:peroxiredoxin
MTPQDKSDALKADLGSALSRALNAGDRAPAFTLPDPSGVLVSSIDLVREGPLVATFYRGVWCPYCQLDLKALEAITTDVRSYRASLVAIAHQTVPNSNRNFQRDNNVSFPILDDKDGDVAVAFGIGWTSAYLQSLYDQFSAEQTGFNPERSWIVPMQARYVIGPDSVIAYAEISSDYHQRPEPPEILPVLRSLKTGATP